MSYVKQPQAHLTVSNKHHGLCSPIFHLCIFFFIWDVIMLQSCCDNLAASLMSSMMEMMKSHNSCNFLLFCKVESMLTLSFKNNPLICYPNISLKANTHIKQAQSATTALISNSQFLYFPLHQGAQRFNVRDLLCDSNKRNLLCGR